MEGCEWRHHPQLHTAIGTLKLNPAAETFHPLQAVKEETPASGMPTTYATCGVIEDPPSVQLPGKVALQMIPVILEGRNSIKIEANAFLNGGSGSSYLKEEIADVLGLDAEH